MDQSVLQLLVNEKRDSYRGYAVKTPDGRLGKPIRFKLNTSSLKLDRARTDIFINPFTISVQFKDFSIKDYNESELTRISLDEFNVIEQLL